MPSLKDTVIFDQRRAGRPFAIFGEARAELTDLRGNPRRRRLIGCEAGRGAWGASGAICRCARGPSSRRG